MFLLIDPVLSSSIYQYHQHIQKITSKNNTKYTHEEILYETTQTQFTLVTTYKKKNQEKKKKKKTIHQKTKKNKKKKIQ